MILRAIIDHELKTFELREGMAFGSNPGCDVVVPHARDYQAFLCVDSEGAWLEAFAAPDVEAGRFPLELGSVFAIGQTIFDCIEAPVVVREEEKIEPVRRACPRCRASLLAVDLSAKFCPHCGGPLPPDCPEWPLVAPDSAPAPEPKTRRWMTWMPLWLRTRVARDPLFFARRTTVLAYINTLFNMGLKYEAGVDAERQLPEAMRYYRKAANLGSLPARARLKVKDRV